MVASVRPVQRQTTGMDDREECERRDATRLLTQAIAVVGVRAASRLGGRPQRASDV
jgi:hypothetical protein